MMILVTVVVVVILVVLVRAKKRKQQLEINKLQKVTTENIQMKLTRSTEIEASSSAYQPPYEEIQTVAQPNIPRKAEELME